MSAIAPTAAAAASAVIGDAVAAALYQRAPLRIKLLSEHATMPVAGSHLAAGLDLSSAVDVVIPPSGRALVPTGLALACPPGTYGRIAPRSGLAYKKGIDVGAGVIDADYRGPVGVILFNWGDAPFEIKVGDRIAQLILEQIVLPDVCQVDDLSSTERGADGFGSTGVSKKQRTVSPTDEQPPPPTDAEEESKEESKN